MNALRQLTANYTADCPSESYASIGRRGSTPGHLVPTQSVHALATRPQMWQTPHRMTIAALARRCRLLLPEMRLQRLSQRAVVDTLLPRRGPQSNVLNSACAESQATRQAAKRRTSSSRP
jgi:hypothetical protein